MVSMTGSNATTSMQVPQEWDVFDVCLDAGVVGLGYARKEPGTSVQVVQLGAVAVNTNTYKYYIQIHAQLG